MAGPGPNGQPRRAKAGEAAITVEQVIKTLDSMASFIGKRRLTPVVEKPAKSYGDGYADGCGFAIEAILATRRQLVAKVAEKAREQEGENSIPE